LPTKSISWCHLILMKKLWGQYPGNFETKFFPSRFEGILYNSVGRSDTRCQYNNPRTAIDKYAFMCGSNFYESDVITYFVCILQKSWFEYQKCKKHKYFFILGHSYNYRCSVKIKEKDPIPQRRDTVLQGAKQRKLLLAMRILERVQPFFTSFEFSDFLWFFP
jgi:hypothetical protein